MTTSLERFGFLSAEETDIPYLSYPVAVEAGVLLDPEEMAKPLGDPAGVTLASGFLPNAREAGLVDAGKEIIAFDLTSLDLSDDQIRITSAPKSSVENDGKITEEGVVVLQNLTGLLRLVAFAIDSLKRPWLADCLRSPKSFRGPDDRISLFSARALQMPDLEVTEIDLVTNSVLARVRPKYY